MKLKDELTRALVRYDMEHMRKSQKNPRIFYNPNALYLYLQAVDGVIEDVENGVDAEMAIARHFNKPLIKILIKAIK